MKKLLSVFLVLLFSYHSQAQNKVVKHSSKPPIKKTESILKMPKPTVRQGTLLNKTFYDYGKTLKKEVYYSMSDDTKQGNYAYFYKSGILQLEAVFDKGDLVYASGYDEFGNILNCISTSPEGETKKIIYNYKDDTDPSEKKIFVRCILSTVQDYIINATVFNENGSVAQKFNSNCTVSQILDEEGNIKGEFLNDSGNLKIEGVLILNSDTIHISSVNKENYFFSPTPDKLFDMYKLLMQTSDDNYYDNVVIQKSTY